MTAVQILQLIVSHPPQHKVDVDFLLKEFAMRLAAVSHKLTDKEVISLTLLASYLFHGAGDELISSAIAHELFKNLRKE